MDCSDTPSKDRSKTILVVDDHEAVRNLVAMLLKPYYALLVAESGEAALQQAKNHNGPIDLLLSDIEMPGGMTGFELAAILTAERFAPRVVLMSGYTPSGVLLLHEEWKFLRKPFVRAQLLDMVQSALSILD